MTAGFVASPWNSCRILYPLIILTPSKTSRIVRNMHLKVLVIICYAVSVSKSSAWALFWSAPFCAVMVHSCERWAVPVTNRSVTSSPACWLQRTVFAFRPVSGRCWLPDLERCQSTGWWWKHESFGRNRRTYSLCLPAIVALYSHLTTVCVGMCEQDQTFAFWSVQL